MKILLLTPSVVALALAASAGAAQTPTDIYLLELQRVEGRLTVAGPPKALIERDGYDNQPHFTPDGRILFTSIRDGQADSYRHDPATGRTVRVTRTSESEYSPTPIPGTRRFSVVRVEADSIQRLWSFTMDGSEPTLLLEDVEPVGYHSWLDGFHVALFVLGDPPTLRVADTRTGRARVLAEGIGRSIQPVPGGGAVTFTQEIGDRWWIRQYELASDSIRPVAPLPGADEYHAWLPDGTLLTASGTRVLRYDPTARRWDRVADVSSAGLGPITRLAASTDGRLLAIVVDRAGGEPVPAGPGGGGGLLSFTSLVIGSLLAMVNPLGALTIFVGLTASYSVRHRRLTAFWGAVTAVAILLVFAMFGTAILRFFGITTYAFRIAGGILFFGIGLDMLQAKRSRSKTTPEEELESADKHEVAVVPLGIPTLAGPGAITTVIALMGQTQTATEMGLVYTGIMVVGLLTLLVLVTGPAILRLIGQTGINVFTRLMGLLVMVIGVQFVLDGLGTVIRGWLTP